MTSTSPKPVRAESRRLQIRFLAVSAVLNGLLLILLFWPTSRHSGESPGTGDRKISPPPSVSVRPQGKHAPPPSRPPSIWSRLTSTNFVEFAAHLRRVGCPEETICDILSPLIERSYERRAARTRSGGDFWAVGDQRRRWREQSRQQRVVLQEEEERLRATLTCSPLLDPDYYEPELRLAIDVISGFLGPEVQEQVLRLLMTTEPQIESWRERTDGVFLPEDVVALQGERDHFRTRLNQWVTDAQLEEMELRLIHCMRYAESGRDESLESLALTPGELREFTRITASTEAGVLTAMNPFGELLGEEPAPRDTRSADADLRALLGEARFTEYHRRSDPVFQEAQELARELKHDPDLPLRAYEMIEQLRAEVPALQEQWVADRDAGREAIRERQNVFRQHFEELLAGVPESRRHDLIRNWTEGAIRSKWQRP